MKWKYSWNFFIFFKFDRPNRNRSITSIRKTRKPINIPIFYSLGEYIQLPLQLEEILQDVLQLADLSSNDDERVVSICGQQQEKPVPNGRRNLRFFFF